ncbi:hypothetical protein I79_025545 [Cricetulus griseus]|uniref:Uncharacterized protein n=1 Tax=Cricetulus griseus TaxID=10029 RepID=G3INL8_CRIGR|nr:hypothetical protein I79_025545 [Cricetulus griseus]
MAGKASDCRGLPQKPGGRREALSSSCVITFRGDRDGRSGSNYFHVPLNLRKDCMHWLT